jgi:hypothetical protein
MLIAYIDEVGEAGAFISKEGYRRKRGALDGVSWV